MRGSRLACRNFSTCPSCIRSIWRTSFAASSCLEAPRTISNTPRSILNAYAFKGKGVDTIEIVSVNDAFVMNAWKRDIDQRDEAVFLADGNAEFAKAIGMELDASGNGLGIRSKRYSMVVEDGTVKKLNPEPAPRKVEVSGGDTLLAH